MISKERLEELIEQEATIYDPDTMWKSIGEIKLNKKMKIKDGRLDGDLGDLGLKGAMCSCFVPLEDLVESKEEAEWIIEFGCIERTERFEPLYYDNIDQNYCYEYRFSTKNNHEYTIRVSGKDIILFWTNCNYKEYFKNTKEEYEKLIRRCAKMFLDGDYAN